MKAVKSRLLCLGVAFAAACHGEESTAPTTAAPTGSVTVNASVSPSDIHPGQSAVILVDVLVPESLTATSLYVRFSGLQDDSLNLPVPGAGRFGYRITYTIPIGPIAGSVIATAVAHLGIKVDMKTVSFTVDDDGPPRVSGSISLAPQPGDSVKLIVTGSDAAGITQLSYHVHGAFDATGSNSVSGYPGTTAWSVVVPVPSTVTLGDSVFVDVSALDGFNATSVATVRTRAVDRTPPTLSAAVSAGVYDSAFPGQVPVHFTGDTVLVNVHATDNFKLAWIGWRISGTPVADSVPVSQAVVQQSLAVPVTASMENQRDLVVFARDSSQNVRGIATTEAFVAGSRRIVQAVPDSFAYPSIDFWGYNQRQGRVVGGVNNQFIAMSVQPLSWFRAFGFTGEPMDIPPGSDTTWVSAQGGARLLAVDLFQSPGTVWRSVNMFLDFGPGGVRMTSDRRAMVVGLSYTLTDPGKVAFVNLSTGAVTLRPVSGFPPYLTASGDRTFILGYAGTGQVKAYYVAADSFSATRTLAGGIPTVDSAGDLVLISNLLYDRNLQFVRALGSPTYDGARSLLSYDGQYAYFAVWPGIHKVRVADGVVVDKVWMPSVGRLVELPDRNTLVSIDITRFVAVDLGPTGIMSAGSTRRQFVAIGSPPPSPIVRRSVVPGVPPAAPRTSIPRIHAELRPLKP